jgi:hypothetical protein
LASLNLQSKTTANRLNELASVDFDFALNGDEAEVSAGELAFA